MNPQLVLFDLDGTLADTAPDLARAVNRVLTDAGRAPLALAEVRARVSSGARALLRAGFDEALPEAELESLLKRLLACYGQAPAAGTRLFPGLAELLAKLGTTGPPWGVVTNKPEALAAAVLTALDPASAPLCLIGGDTLARKKPDPLPLLEACRRAGVEPGMAVYVGDAEIDARAAAAAGMPLIVAGFGYAPNRAETRAWGRVHYAADVAELACLLGLRDALATGTA